MIQEPLQAAPPSELERPFLPEPASLQETGLELGLVADLSLKTLYHGGRTTAGGLAGAMALSVPVVQEVLEFLTRDGLCEVIGGEGRGFASYRYALTGRGLERSATAFERNTYVGPAPVLLADYVRQVQRQSVSKTAFSPGLVADALKRLVMSIETLTRVGRAISSGRSTLLYGPSGNGKTTIVQALGAALPGHILIPHALDVYGHIVRLFDASKHHPAEEPEQGRGPLGRRVDQRWLLIRRPAVLAGGELTRHSLELVFDDRSKVYEAPLQMKANGGILVIDDLGRQQMPAVELLNRWIVTLEGGVDHLSLHTGQTIEVPFDVIPLFSTNLPPERLADEAFLRRIRYKVEIPDPTPEEFRAIFERVCQEHGLQADEAVVDYLLAHWYERLGYKLRGCHPRDLVEAIVDAARYEGGTVALSPETVDEACRTYFLGSLSEPTGQRRGRRGRRPTRRALRAAAAASSARGGGR